MSKSLGNSPDPIELIEKYGADGVRLGILISSPAGNDLPFDSSQCEQGRNFTNKVWNAARLVKGWEVKDIPQPAASKKAIEWFHARFNQELENINDLMAKFRISEALMAIYKLVWDDFCSWYLEMVKPPYGEGMDKETYHATLEIFDKILRLLHPFMPFLTEEIWQTIQIRSEKETICLSAWPVAQEADKKWLDAFDEFSEIIIGIRNIRKENQIANKEKLVLNCLQSQGNRHLFHPVIEHLGNIEETIFLNEKPTQCYSFIVKGKEYFIPFTENFDVEAEKAKLVEEIKYTEGFLALVQKKLSNEGFVSKAPLAVLDAERKKQADAVAKIELLTAQLKSLN